MISNYCAGCGSFLGSPPETKCHICGSVIHKDNVIVTRKFMTAETLQPTNQEEKRGHLLKLKQCLSRSQNRKPV